MTALFIIIVVYAVEMFIITDGMEHTERLNNVFMINLFIVLCLLVLRVK